MIDQALSRGGSHEEGEIHPLQHLRNRVLTASHRTVRPMLLAKMKPFIGVWLYTNTVTDPALSPAKGPDRLVWSVGSGTVSVPPVSPVALACPTSTPFATKFTTGSPAPRLAK